jgi:hypothetical protein
MRLYDLGRLAAFEKVGIDADAFAQMAQQDDTGEFVNQNGDPDDQASNVNKPPAWSGQTSMDAGDAGTRNYQMGLPRSGGV